MLNKAYIPYGGYYSSPFCRWQGSLANENAIELGAKTARRWFSSRDLDPTIVDYVYYGITVAQHYMFHSHNWAAAMLVDGKKNLPGLMVNQACTTSTTCIHLAAVNIEAGTYETAFALMSDRCSNGPHTVWPQPLGPGGEVESENWMMDNFEDPWGGMSMTRTAENVAAEAGITRKECDAVALRRYEQYQDSVKDDRAFQKRYMFPAEVKVSRKRTIMVEEDEGITPSTAEGLAKLKPVEPNGILTFGSQTHPADGNCGFIVTTREKAKELSTDPKTEIQIMSYGFARAKKAYMAQAPVPAAQMALNKNAGLTVKDMKVVKTHNPFAVNDIYMSKQMDIDVMWMNNYGSSLIFGHPQSPTAGRLIAELVEELVLLGGGYGLWAGCAAGDTGAALVVKVG